MNMKNKLLFLFNKDLRLQDNKALYQVFQQNEQVIPLYVFDEESIQASGVKTIKLVPQEDAPIDLVVSEQKLQFLVESLQDLDAALQKYGSHLYSAAGNIEKVVSSIINHESISGIYANYEYTPSGIRKQKMLEAICKKAKISCEFFHDELLLGDPAEFLNKQGSFYKMFTPFYNAASKLPLAQEMHIKSPNFFTGALKNSFKIDCVQISESQWAVKGGLVQAEKRLKALKKYDHYIVDRDIPSKDATTHFSAYLSLGCISARQLACALGDQLKSAAQPIIRQLYWRDFYSYIGYHVPHVYKKVFQEKYTDLSWNYNQKAFAAWCKGKTGFPIIDAGMRELNATGYMHNRVRLLTASFLTKDLHISWQKGERYFADHLIDYDAASNNGNWQWVASTGCDASPYFRIFNPWLQQKKFDPECEYIKTWVPELKKIDPKLIHAYFKGTIEIPGYPKPLVDHTKESQITKMRYKRL